VSVSGSGAVWTNSSYLYVGYYGPGNSLVISNGGTVVNASGNDLIGGNPSSSNNSVLVTGNGSVWNCGQDLAVGYGGVGNSLVISNGGTVVNLYGYIGLLNSSSNNSVLVTGSGSVWTNSRDVLVGHYGSSNSLVISNGGTAVSSNLFVGYDTGSRSTAAI
jgi:T5SS/PEP-CTERM-associated repeat protein